MNLYFLRHGVAVERGNEDYSEEDRPLTPEGSDKMIAGVAGIKKLKISLDALLSSPLVRAFQTAQIVQEHLPFKGKIEVEKALLPGGSLEDFLKKLKNRAEENVMLVGHEPTMSRWIQNLLGCDPIGSVRLKKGSLCHLLLEWRGARPMAELITLLQPRTLRQID